MGAITRAAANNITTGGVILPAGINDTSVASISELEQVATGGGLNLISSQTASGSASIEFTSGIDSTYDIYKFEFINIQSGDEGAGFAFQVDTGTNTNYNQTITSTFFDAYHNEGDTANDLRYLGDRDQANGTALQPLSVLSSGGSDEADSGTLILYNPSSSTFVKHFMSRFSNMIAGNYAGDAFGAGYINTTTPITRIKFALTSGNITSGTIRMYGIQSS